jgi:hypothetical protein
MGGKMLDSPAAYFQDMHMHMACRADSMHMHIHMHGMNEVVCVHTEIAGACMGACLLPIDPDALLLQHVDEDFSLDVLLRLLGQLKEPLPCNFPVIAQRHGVGSRRPWY